MRFGARRFIAVLTVVSLALAVSALRSPAALAAATCTTTVATNYTVQVCITAPAAGATLNGPTTVTATQTVIQGSGRRARLQQRRQRGARLVTEPLSLPWRRLRDGDLRRVL